MEYRKSIELCGSTPYWFVELGEFMNGGCQYPFPSAEAARRFAVNEKVLASRKGLNRFVRINHPDGKEEVL